MVRLVHVTVPKAQADRVKPLLQRIEDTYGLVHIEAVDHALFTFRIKEKKMQYVMDSLEEMGVGVDPDTNIDIIQLEMTKPRLPKTSNKRGYRWDDRKTIEEIHETVDSGYHLTFDYLCFIFVGSCICAGGLITNSSVLVVASMLVSPLMGPILGLTFGVTVGDRVMAQKSFRNEVIGMAFTFFVGCVIGMVLGQFSAVSDLTTKEMTDRGTWIALVAGVGIAIPSGVGVAIATTSEGVAALVGVAISASLLPPIVNSGINFSFFFIQKYRDNGQDGVEPLTIAMYSLSLFLLNWVLILLSAMLTFKLKNVSMNRSHSGQLKGKVDVSLVANPAAISTINSTTADISQPLLVKEED